VQRKGSNRIRIIGGAWRRRVLHFPSVAGLRPTPDRVRETLFNWLGQDLTGKRCLDLFAGAGALGFEAASRGAAEVTMVEHSRSVLQSLRDNAALLGADQVRLVQGDALHFLAAAQVGTYDVVFVDPPYGSGLVPTVLAHLPRVLAPDALVYVESGSALALPAPWRVWREATASAVHYGLVQRGKE
jgi:16S rRNA (guanine966-N2)-methyltransferase